MIHPNQVFKVLSVLAASCLHSQVMAVTIERIQPVSSIDEQCIDIEPLNDEWGWNGTCSCLLGADNHDLFGYQLAAGDAGLAVGASQSPGGCFDSGTVTFYQMAADGKAQLRQEVISGDSRNSRDFFAHKPTALGDKYMAILSDVGQGDATKLLHVFSNESGDWTQIYTLQDTEDPYNGFFFGESASIVGDELFVDANFNGVQRFRASDGTLLQTLNHTDPGRCTGTFLNDGDSLLTTWFACTEDGVSDLAVLYQLEGGRYEEVLRVEPNGRNWFRPLIEGDLLTLEVDDDFVTYRRDANGNWTEVVRQSIDSIATPAHLYGGQLFAHGADSLTIYALDSEAGWRVTQEISLSDADNIWHTDIAVAGNRVTMVRSMATFYDPPYISNEYVAFDPETVPEVYVFDKNNEGIWQQTFSQKFEGGGNQPLANVVATKDNAFVTLSSGGFVNLYFGDDETNEPELVNPDDSSTDQTSTDQTSTDQNAEGIVESDDSDDVVDGNNTNDEPVDGGGSIAPLVIFLLCLRRVLVKRAHYSGFRT